MWPKGVGGISPVSHGFSMTSAASLSFSFLARERARAVVVASRRVCIATSCLSRRNTSSPRSLREVAELGCDGGTAGVVVSSFSVSEESLSDESVLLDVVDAFTRCWARNH